MKISYFTVLNILSFIVLFTSCSPNYYNPSSAVSPDLKKKGDAVLSLNATASDANGKAGEIAISPLKNIGLILRGESNEYEYTNSVKTNRVNDYGIPIYAHYSRKISNNLFTFGGGYYSTFDKSIQIQVYSTYGLGAFKDGSFRGDFTKVGLHPSLIIPLGKVEFGLHSSLIRLKFKETVNDLRIDEKSQKEYLADYNTNFIYEQFITIKSRFKYINVYLQAGSSRNYSHEDFAQSESSFTAGVSINFHSFAKSSEDL